MIVSAAYNRLNNLADAEEAAAEVFRIAWHKRELLRDTQRLAWLYATLRNVIGNEYRRRSRADRRNQRVKDELIIDTSDDDYDRSDRIEVREAIAALAVPDRELIWMAYWEELTREEMAEVIGCSIASVRVRLYRARVRLKTVLHHLASQGRGGGDHD